MLTTAHSARPGSLHLVRRSRDQKLCKLTGVVLFLLLVYTTATVFVPASWPMQSFQIGVYALVAGYVLSEFGEAGISLAAEPTSWLVYLIPVWGILQLVAHTTASTFETREAVLRWGSLAGVFFLSQAVMTRSSLRELALNWFLAFATAMAILCMAQLFTSDGSVLWLFPSGYPDVYGTFQNHNNFAQFEELAFPIALWGAVREGWRGWWYIVSAGLIFASVVGSASRFGVLLCVAELVMMVVYGWFKLPDRNNRTRSRVSKSGLVMVPLLAIGFTLAVGWQQVMARFMHADPNIVRQEYIVSAVKMAKAHPFMGFGLGTFPEAYQQFAVKDFPFYANHAHCDWAEFAADGGIPFLLLVLIPFLAAVPRAIRSPWAWGLIALMLHACVDYPFPRPAVSGWMFAMLGMLYVIREEPR